MHVSASRPSAIDADEVFSLSRNAAIVGTVQSGYDSMSLRSRRRRQRRHAQQRASWNRAAGKWV